VGGLCNWDYCVFCGVQTVCLNTYLKAFVVPRTACSMTRVIRYGLSPSKPRFYPGLVRVRLVVAKVVLGQVSLSVLPLSHLSIIPTVLRTHHHFNTTEKRTSVWGFKLPNIVIPFQMFGNINQKSTFTLFLFAWKNEIVVLWSD